MEVTWLGGSCFRLQASGLRILTDPFDLPPQTPLQSGDVVTVSRRVPPERLAVADVYRLVDGPGEYEIRGVPFTGIATPLSDQGPPGGAAGEAGAAGGDPSPGATSDRRNVIYTMVLEGITVCHLGRLDRPPGAAQLQEMGTPDVVLIPVGEGGGLGAPQAVQLVSQLEAKLLLPVPLGGGQGEAAVERFCRELGADPQNVSPRLSVSASGLPAQTQVVRLAAVPSATRGGAPDA
jgi:L-ascorbate metabolism protein UlaG (beta-lactamase superfamily)